MKNKKQPLIKDGKYTVNNPATVAEMERALTAKLRAQQVKESHTDFGLSGDMAQQFNESQEQPDVFDEQDPNGL
jgi:hypothetical protein